MEEIIRLQEERQKQILERETTPVVTPISTSPLIEKEKESEKPIKTPRELKKPDVFQKKPSKREIPTDENNAIWEPLLSDVATEGRICENEGTVHEILEKNRVFIRVVWRDWVSIYRPTFTDPVVEPYGPEKTFTANDYVNLMLNSCKTFSKNWFYEDYKIQSIGYYHESDTECFWKKLQARYWNMFISQCKKRTLHFTGMFQVLYKTIKDHPNYLVQPEYRELHEMKLKILRTMPYYFSHYYLANPMKMRFELYLDETSCKNGTGPIDVRYFVEDTCLTPVNEGMSIEEVKELYTDLIFD